MVRILYIDNAIAIYGGIERVLIDKINWPAENSDIEIYLLTICQGDHPFVYQLNSKVKYHDLDIQFHKIYQHSKWKRIYFMHRLTEFIKSSIPDILICTRIDFVSDIINRSVNDFVDKVCLLIEEQNLRLKMGKQELNLRDGLKWEASCLSGNNYLII